MDLHPSSLRLGQGNESGTLQVCVREDLWLNSCDSDGTGGEGGRKGRATRLR